LYRGVSRIACLAVFVFLLLGVISLGLFVSATGSMSTTQTKPPWSSVPMTNATQLTHSTPVAQSTRTTSSVSTNQPASDIAMSNAANETAFMVLPQEVSVNVGDTFSVSIFAENLTDTCMLGRSLSPSTPHLWSALMFQFLTSKCFQTNTQYLRLL